MWTRGLILAVVTTGFFATAVAFSVQVWAQQYTSANHAAIIFTLEPVFAGLTSFFFYHERLSARSLVGAALILGGILIAELLGPTPAAESSVPPAETLQHLP
jgi:drug/metabolite transporter (DMT)-like permease